MVPIKNISAFNHDIRTDILKSLNEHGRKYDNDLGRMGRCAIEEIPQEFLLFRKSMSSNSEIDDVHSFPISKLFVDADEGFFEINAIPESERFAYKYDERSPSN